jgi:hypothetical protein
MTYRVVWAPFAEGWLDQYLSAAAERGIVAEASKEIDRQLMTGPKAFGESRDDAVRIGDVRPLGILFEVFDDVRTVVVYDVWRIDRT